MHPKSDTCNCFLVFKAAAEKNIGKKIKALSSDGGGEYHGRGFLYYLCMNRI